MQSIHPAVRPQAAPETSAQIAEHRRIARAHDPRLKIQFFSMRSQRLSELMEFTRYTFGATLPDDDWGRDVLQQILNQLALAGASPDVLRARGRDLLPEVDEDDSLDIMVLEIGTGRRIKAEPLGRAIGLTYQARVALDITTIGCFDVSPAARKAITAQKRAGDKRWNREKAGAKPQAQSERQTRPWIALRICKRTYQARKKAMAEMVQTDAVAPKRPDHDEVITGAAIDGANSLSTPEVAEIAPTVEATAHIETEHAERQEEAIRGEVSKGLAQNPDTEPVDRKDAREPFRHDGRRLPWMDISDREQRRLAIVAEAEAYLRASDALERKLKGRAA